MCTVDIQYVNAFVNRLYRKEVKDKHNKAIEKWEMHSIVAYSHPLSYSMQQYKKGVFRFALLCLFRVITPFGKALNRLLIFFYLHGI